MKIVLDTELAGRRRGRPNNMKGYMQKRHDNCAIDIEVMDRTVLSIAESSMTPDDGSSETELKRV